MTKRWTLPRRVLIGLLAAAVLLAGFRWAPGPIRTFLSAGSPSAPPTSLQVEALLAEQAGQAPFVPVKSPLAPDATAGENAAMLASDTLLLNLTIFTVDLPLITR